MSSPQALFTELLAEIPAEEADFFEVLSWGHRFNAYDRWGSGPTLLFDLLRPLLQQLEEHGRFNDQPGCDAVRALMFFKVRQHHFTDSDPSEVLDFFKVLRRYVAARASSGE